MLILRKNEIKKIFTMKDAIQANTEALSLYSEGKTNVPLRVNIDVAKDGQCLFMPAYVADNNAIGIKLVSVFPKNIENNKPSLLSQMILIDPQTGEICAIIDGTYLTQLRTGALQGLATDLLARSDAKVATVFGTGGQAATQLEALLVVRNLTEINVFDINLDRAKKFAAIMQTEFAQYNVKIEVVNDQAAAITKADIITTVTTSKKPVFDGTLVKPGTHVNGIGAYTPEMQELPETLVNNADKIIFDTKEGVLAEAGDIIIPMKEGTLTTADIDGELGEIILRKIKGRETEHEITLFKAVGTALLDVVVAQQIYQTALKQKIGEHIEI